MPMILYAFCTLTVRKGHPCNPSMIILRGTICPVLLGVFLKRMDMQAFTETFSKIISSRGSQHAFVDDLHVRMETELKIDNIFIRELTK